MSAVAVVAWIVLTLVNLVAWVAAGRMMRGNRRLLAECREHLDLAVLSIESRRAVLSYCSTLRGMDPSPDVVAVLDRIQGVVSLHD